MGSLLFSYYCSGEFVPLRFVIWSTVHILLSSWFKIASLILFQCYKTLRVNLLNCLESWKFLILALRQKRRPEHKINSLSFCCFSFDFIWIFLFKCNDWSSKCRVKNTIPFYISYYSTVLLKFRFFNKFNYRPLKASSSVLFNA